jgi:hypothetical protein
MFDGNFACRKLLAQTKHADGAAGGLRQSGRGMANDRHSWQRGEKMKNQASKPGARIVQPAQGQNAGQINIVQRSASIGKSQVAPPPIYRPNMSLPMQAKLTSSRPHPIAPAKLVPMPTINAPRLGEKVHRGRWSATNALAMTGLIQRSKISASEMVAAHQAEKLKPYVEMLPHLAGDVKKNKKTQKVTDLSGGHILLEVRKKFPKAAVSHTPNKHKAWAAYWTNDATAQPPIYKWSSFFPASWSNDDVLKNVLDTKVEFEKKGDTFFPTGLTEPDAQSSTIQFIYK